MSSDDYFPSDTPLTDALTHDINEKLAALGHRKRLDLDKIKNTEKWEEPNKGTENTSSSDSTTDTSTGEPPWTSMLL